MRNLQFTLLTDRVFVAKFEANEVPPQTYQVDFVAGDGVSFTADHETSFTVEEGTPWAGSITVPGYTADGAYDYVWTNTSKNAGFDNPETQVPADFKVDKNLEFTLTRTLKTYTVNFVAGSGLPENFAFSTDASFTVNHGDIWSEKITVPGHNVDTEVYELGWTLTQGVGLNVNDPSANADYAIVQNVTYTLSAKKIITITPPPTEYDASGEPVNNVKVYGEDDPPLELVFPGASADLIAQLKNDLKAVREPGEDVDIYDISVVAIDESLAVADIVAKYADLGYKLVIGEDTLFHIIRRPIVITLGNADATYTGEPITKGLTVTPEEQKEGRGLLAGHVVDPGLYEAKQTDVDVYLYGDDEDVDVNVVDAFSINDSNTNSVTSNYLITFEEGTFTISNSTGLKVVLSGKTVIYDGEYKYLEDATATIDGVTTTEAKIWYRIVELEDIDDYTDDATNPWSTGMPQFTPVGPKYLQVRATLDNHENAHDYGVLVINPFKITVTLGTNEKTFGEADPDVLLTKAATAGAGTYSITEKPGVNASDLVWPEGTLDLSRELAGVTPEGEKVRTGSNFYAISTAAGTDEELRAAVEAANPNYIFEFGTGAFRINPYEVEIEVDPKDPVEDKEKENEDEDPFDPYNPFDPEGGDIGSGNSKIYGKVDPALTAKLVNEDAMDGLEPAVDPSDFVLKRVTGEDVGKHDIYISNWEELVESGKAKLIEPEAGPAYFLYDDTYKISLAESNFYILKRPVELVLPEATKTYGDEDPVFATATINDKASAGDNLYGFSIEDIFANTVVRHSEDVDYELVRDTIRLVHQLRNDLSHTDGSDFWYGDGGNYKLSAADGSLAITPRLLTISANGPGSFTHTGGYQSITGHTVRGLATGDKWQDQITSAISVVTGGTAVGRHENTNWGSSKTSLYISGLAANQVNLVDNYTVNWVDTYVDIGAALIPATWTYTINYYVGAVAGAPVATSTRPVANGGGDIVLGAADLNAAYPGATHTGGTIVSGNAANITAGSFTITADGQHVNVLYTAVPVPPADWTYTVQYWQDAVGGTLLNEVTGTVPVGGGPAAIDIAGNHPGGDYLPGSVIAGDNTMVTVNGQLIRVLYTTEEVVPPIDNPIENPIDEPVPPEPNPIVVPEVAWALLNLMIAVLSLVFGVMLVFGLFMRNKKKEEQSEEAQEAEETERNPKSGLGWRILAILAGIAAPIVFFITENMRNPMIFVDKWTPLMVIILVVQVIGMLLLRRARNQEDENDEAESEA